MLFRRDILQGIAEGTESLEVGYRLSPRGRLVLQCIVNDSR